MTCHHLIIIVWIIFERMLAVISIERKLRGLILGELPSLVDGEKEKGYSSVSDIYVLMCTWLDVSSLYPLRIDAP